MGKKYQQDSILFIDSNGNAEWVGTRKDSYCGGINQTIPYGKFHPKLIGDYYTKIGKKHFSFTDITEGEKEIMLSKETSIERRGREYFLNCLVESTKNDVDFYDYWMKKI